MKRKIGNILAALKLKQLALKPYFFFGNAGSALKAGVRRVIVPGLIRRRQKDGILAIDICNIHGLGAKLEWALEIMAYCEEMKLRPRFRFSYPGSEDYFADYFYIPNAREDERGIKFTRIKEMSELGLAKDYDKLLSIGYANQLIVKYLGIKEFILAEVDGFCRDHFGDKKILGIHYRSTDKAGEAPTVPYEKVKMNMEHYIDRYPETAAAFISTDDKNFSTFIQSRFQTCPLIFREDYFRSSDHSSVHHNQKLDKYEVNRDALINCLLLSRCHALIKTSSFLSDWSKLFNPSLPVVVLNKPYDQTLWFPASQIMKELLYSPV